MKNVVFLWIKLRGVKIHKQYQFYYLQDLQEIQQKKQPKT